MPGDFAHRGASPAGKIVGMNGGVAHAGPSGAGVRSHFMRLKMGLCVTETITIEKLIVRFQEAVDFAHHLVGRVPRHRERHVAAVSSTSWSRSSVKPRAARGAMIPSRARPDRQVGTGGLSVTRGIGGVVDLMPRDPFVQPPHIVLRGVARERRAQRHHRAHPLRRGPRQLARDTPRRGSSRPPAPAAFVADRIDAGFQPLDACRPAPRVPALPHG